MIGDDFAERFHQGPESVFSQSWECEVTIAALTKEGVCTFLANFLGFLRLGCIVILLRQMSCVLAKPTGRATTRSSSAHP